MKYSNIKKLYSESIYDTKSRTENVQLIFLSFAGFFLPFILGHPQVLIGTLVNAMLIIGATYLKGPRILPLIVLPGLGVLSAGVIFGTYTPFLLYMLPVIWLGNALYVYLYKYFNIDSRKIINNISGVLVASIFKAALLLSAAFIMARMSLLDSVFLNAMGLLQLFTAVTGGLSAIGIIQIIKRNSRY